MSPQAVAAAHASGVLYTTAAGLPADPIELYRQEPSVCLITPTATLAEHLRHQIAREGLLVRPDSIVTLSRFIEPWVKNEPQVTSAALDWLGGQVLHDRPPAEFQSLSHASGLRRILCSTVEEVASAGATAAMLAHLPNRGFASFFQAIEEELTSRGWYLRSQRVRLAASRIQAHLMPTAIYRFIGFYSLTPAELELVDALRPSVIGVSLPDWDGSNPTRDCLIQRGFIKQALARFEAIPPATVIRAGTTASEADEIARRILIENSRGRPFREMGVVLRSAAPYSPLLETTFQRYGIPARLYFQRSLAEHSLIRYFRAVLDAVLSNWDFDVVKHVIDMSYSGLGGRPAGDQLAHELRRQTPGRGIPAQLPWADALDEWGTSAYNPQQWIEALVGLRNCITLPSIQDQVSHRVALEWRQLGTALEAWDDALRECGTLLDPDQALSLAAFRRALDTVLEQTHFDDADQRRNVVHVLDVYEARQWRLPVIFIAGLVERSFPQYHGEHAILGDDDRFLLRGQGVILRTSRERQSEERFLFDTACSAATEQLTLSYPESNENGDDSLPSFFLRRVEGTVVQPVPVRPRAKRARPPARAIVLQDRDVLSALRKSRTSISPTSIETFLQCPFQYFAGHMLKLKSPPQKPEDRLDFLLQGNILHDTLAEAEGSPLFVEETFARLFAEACEKHAIPATCRTERIRLELLANLRRFLDSPPLKGGRTVSVERPFDLPLAGTNLRLRGKIDRVVELPHRGLVVIDYKYSTRVRIRDRVRSHERGELVQGGLYLWAAEKLYKQQPAGMLYCGLRGEVTWDGWHIPVFGWQDVGESWDVEAMRQLMNRALESSTEVATRIAAGEIKPDPADRKKCEWCDFQDLCRIESQTGVTTAARGAGSS